MVTNSIGYTNPAKAMADHCKGITKRYPLPTAGGTQEVRILSEPDVLRFAVRCMILFVNWSLSMIEIAVGLYLLLAAGLFGMAAKYAFGPLPVSHHRAALERDEVPLTPNLLTLLRAVYIPMSAAIAAFAVLLSALALGPIADGEQWASLAATGAALLLGVPTTISTWMFEKRTGVRGPYRLAAIMTVLAIVALPLAP